MIVRRDKAECESTISSSESESVIRNLNSRLSE